MGRKPIQRSTLIDAARTGKVLFGQSLPQLSSFAFNTTDWQGGSRICTIGQTDATKLADKFVLFFKSM
jgi:hypothetical protein